MIPAFAGSGKGLSGGGVPLEGVRVDRDEGEMTLLRSGPKQAVLVSLGERKKRVPDTFRRAGGRMARWLRQREIGSALDWHIQRAAVVAQATLGEPIDAERSVGEVARDVLACAGWLPKAEALPDLSAEAP